MIRPDFLKAAEYAERADWLLDSADREASEGDLITAHYLRLEAAGWHRAELRALRGAA